MASTIRVDKLDPQSGTALEIGTSGDTVTVPSGVGLTLTDSTLLLPTTITSTTEVKTNKISPATGTAFALGDSGDTFTVPSGATIVNSGTATGFGGGKILQVVPVVWKTNHSSTDSNGTFDDITDATATITPSSTDSLIWVNVMITTGCETYSPFLKIQLGGSDIAGALGQAEGVRTVMTAMSVGGTSDNAEMQSTYISYVDSPASTSALTYTIQGSGRAAGTWTVNYPYDNGNYNYNGHAISTITLLEIDGS